MPLYFAGEALASRASKWDGDGTRRVRIRICVGAHDSLSVWMVRHKQKA
jgi:hypothetical protein